MPARSRQRRPDAVRRHCTAGSPYGSCETPPPPTRTPRAAADLCRSVATLHHRDMVVPRRHNVSLLLPSLTVVAAPDVRHTTLLGSHTVAHTGRPVVADRRLHSTSASPWPRADAVSRSRTATRLSQSLARPCPSPSCRPARAPATPLATIGIAPHLRMVCPARTTEMRRRLHAR